MLYTRCYIRGKENNVGEILLGLEYNNRLSEDFFYPEGIASYNIDVNKIMKYIQKAAFLVNSPNEEPRISNVFVESKDKVWEIVDEPIYTMEKDEMFSQIGYFIFNEVVNKTIEKLGKLYEYNNSDSPAFSQIGSILSFLDEIKTFNINKLWFFMIDIKGHPNQYILDNSLVPANWDNAPVDIIKNARESWKHFIRFIQSYEYFISVI